MTALKALLPADTLPLGFGCGQLYPRPSRHHAVRLLDAALDAGITYFDTARLYGHGEAEGLLGSIVPRVRGRVILASKAGILPTQMPLMRKVQNKAAHMLRRAPALRSLVPEPEPVKPRFGAFGIPELCASVETSLRELKTDYLDILLLHECTLAQAANPEILAFLKSLKQQGKIRTWGIATSVEVTLQAASFEKKPPVLQFAHSLWDRAGEPLLGAPPCGQAVTHSALGAPFKALMERLKGDAAMAKAWSDRLGLDARDGSALARLALGYALHANPGGVVLFSSSKEEHIRSCVKAVKVTAAQAEAVGELVAASL